MSKAGIRFDPRRLAALVRKEGTQIMRDPSTFLIAFVLPLILLFLFGYAVSLDTPRTRIALVLEDSSAPALDLAQAYRNSPYFDVAMARSVADVRGMMVDGAVRAIIVIPQDFGKGATRGKAPPIQIITDGSQPNTASFAAAYGEGVRASWAAAEGPDGGASQVAPPIGVNPRYWYNPGLRSRFFLVPGSIAIVMTMIGTLLTALVVAREWERGTMEAMMATPISMAEFIASKVIPYFLLGLASMALCSVLAVVAFGVPFRGSVVALFAIASAFLMPALGLGLFISSATKNQFVASQVALLAAFLPTFLLSGFLFEIASMPWPIRLITYAVPARYLIPSLQTVFLAGDLWALILPNIAIMLGFGALFFFLSFRATRRSLD
ncbi:MAG: ABC transporter permease [Candidatus Sphingomonas phytovorans]|nr:ABC transporter permease [Sphingomonas sp.]WEJ97806.1 MAG: ABC transporter permease [Sphingomonas sp.]